MPPLHPLEVDQSYADVGERRQSPKVFNIPSLDAPIQFQVYSGQSVFLVASGPSFRKIDSTQLSQPGIVSMGVNNSPKSFRPNLWVSVDNPHKFLRSIWIDPQITKFVRETHLNETLFDSSHWTPTRERPSDCPNVISFCSSVEFDASSYLSEDTVCWGNSIERGSGRSVLLAALKILYSLGFQHVFLVGVDFEMKPARPYHFDENCSNDHSYSNQRAYEILSGMLESLQPHFLERNFFVWNCNPDSGLKAFPFFSLENAIEFALRKFPKDLSLERTEGLYQRTPGGNDSMDSPKAQNEIPITAGGMSRISRKR
ncbi:MAG: hypothetical protein MI807_15665, partial [Verrucomicrobiales bacterium]|nr:hypothetical protein [Verrucomicrobiales bacterium]